MSYESTYNKDPLYRVDVYFNSKYWIGALHFINFMKNVAKKHELKILYRSIEPGHIKIIVDKKQGGHLDTLLQELIVSRGLHYYVASLSLPNRKVVIEQVILPIYQDLLESRFFQTHSSKLSQHILATISPTEYVPGDLSNEFSVEYEVLYRRWTLGIVNPKEFILSLDGLLSRFLLKQIAHVDGQRSPKFDMVLKKAYQQGIAMHRDYKRVFEKVHSLRTKGLHRLSADVPLTELNDIALKTFIYFQYFDEFDEAQSTTNEKLSGQLYPRITYGGESRYDYKLVGEKYVEYVPEEGDPDRWSERAKRQTCGDCGVSYGQYHVFSCDMEQCPRCKGQLLSCDCRISSDFDEQ